MAEGGYIGQGAVHRSECIRVPGCSDEPLEDDKEFQVVSREKEEGTAVSLGSRKRRASPAEVGRENKRIRTEEPVSTSSVLEI